MCMGVPMEVIEVDGWVARCSAAGVEQQVNLMLVMDDAVAKGDFVLVHRHHAMRTLTRREAEDVWSILQQALDAGA